MASAEADGRSTPRPSDGPVYLALVSLTLVAWLVSRLGLFESGDDVGYWLGVIGGSMMLLLFTYPLRKHFRFARTWGRVRLWFVAHMVLGVGGPLLILLHSNFRIGSLNAGVALASMVIVALSGVVGRFLYAGVHRGLRGNRENLDELKSRVRMDQHDIRSRLAFAPAIEERLHAFEEDVLQAKPGLPTYMRQVFWLPARKRLLLARCTRQLENPMRRLGAHHGWDAKELVRRKRQARALVDHYLTAIVRVAQYTAYERLFALWHVAHIPFVYSLVFSALAHVVAVHVY